MALEDYRKKRDFSRTPEPAGEVRPPGGSSYCIQKHAATRLHYDFRLELDGVLHAYRAWRADLEGYEPPRARRGRGDHDCDRDDDHHGRGGRDRR